MRLKGTNSLKKLAETISVVLGFPWIVLLIFILIFSSGQTSIQNLLLSLTYMFLLLIIPLGYIIFLRKKGEISNFDITKRTQRYKPLILFLMLLVLCIGIALITGSHMNLKYLTVLFLIVVVNIIITFYWKISLHMTLNIVAIVFINYAYHWKLGFLFLLLPIIFWSRYYLKRHTVSQLLAGMIISGLIAYLGLMYINF